MTSKSKEAAAKAALAKAQAESAKAEKAAAEKAEAAKAAAEKAATDQAAAEKAAEAKAQAAKAAAEGEQPTHIRVATRQGVERFYRCGRAFTREAVEIDLDELEPEEVERLIAEDHLVTDFIVKE